MICHLVLPAPKLLLRRFILHRCGRACCVVLGDKSFSQRRESFNGLQVSLLVLIERDPPECIVALSEFHLPTHFLELDLQFAFHHRTAFLGGTGGTCRRPQSIAQHRPCDSARKYQP